MQYQKAGIIGCMGPESTMGYYRHICARFQEEVGSTWRFPPMVIESLNVFNMIDLYETKDYGGLTDYLVEAVQAVYRAGADFADLSSNTPPCGF